MNETRTAHPTALLISTTVVYYLLDWIKDIYLYARFGPAKLDPFYGSYAIFDAAVNVSMLTAIAAVMMPAMAGAYRQGGERLVERLGTTVLVFAAAALSVVAAGAAVFAPSVLAIYGFRPTSEGILIARLVFAVLPLWGVEKIIRLILEHKGRFGPPVAASLIVRVVFLVVVFASASSWGPVSAGAGSLAGAAASVLFLVVAYFVAGARLRAPLVPGGEPLEHRWLPPLLMLWLANLVAQSPFVDLIFASYFERGSLSLLRLGARIYDVPIALFCVSVGTAIFPRMCDVAAAGDRAALQHHIETGMRRAMYFVLPSMFGLVALARPLVQVIYRRGEFSDRDAGLVTGCLVAYSLGLFAAGMRPLLQRAAYAVRKYAWLILIEVTTLVLNVVFNYVFAILLGWGILGLAFSTTVVSLAMLVVWWILTKRFVGVEHMRTLRLALTKMAACAAFMCAACIIAWRSIAPEPGGVAGALRLAAVVAFGAALYFAGTSALGLEEYADCRSLLRKFLSRGEPSER